MRRTRKLLIATLLATTLVTTAGLAGCSKDDKTATTSSTTTSGATTSAAGGTTTGGSTTTGPGSTPAGTTAVEVYFTRDGSLVASGRNVDGRGVAKAALVEVLDGPDATESGIGMVGGIPAGTELLGLEISGGVATVDLSKAFTSGGGSLSMQLRVGQIVYTLTQFPTVKSVTIHIEGEAVDGIGGEGVAATGLDRAAMANVTPAILVTSPFPGATVKPSFTISGISNTFEANVLWAVSGPDGTVWKEGHTTATAGTGTWGTYRITADLTGHSGPATVKVFEEDAESGGERSAVEVPVTIG